MDFIMLKKQNKNEQESCIYNDPKVLLVVYSSLLY